MLDTSFTVSVISLIGLRFVVSDAHSEPYFHKSGHPFDLFDARLNTPDSVMAYIYSHNDIISKGKLI